MQQKCDVLYIHSIKNPTDGKAMKFAYMPMGIIGILNHLRTKGIQVLGVNYAVEQAYNLEFDLASTLENIEYKILLTDLHWYEHSFGAMYVVEQSKKVHPDVPTVIGGYTSTIFAGEIMENFTGVDYIVTGDSDLPMEQLVEYLLGRSNTILSDIPNLHYRRGSEAFISEKTWVQTSLDDINFIDTDFFLHKEAIPHVVINGLSKKHTDHWLCIARGCKFNCAYCCGANKNMKVLFRRCNILTRSPEKIASDFYELTARGIKQVSPSHDFQMFGKHYYQEVFSEIRNRNVKPGMYLECFQLPTKEYIDDIARTFDKEHLLIAISPISGNEVLRRENGKFFSNDELYEILAYMKEKGVAAQLYYTLNPVGETKEQFNDTYFQMKYLRVMYRFGRSGMVYQRVVVDPLAGLRDFEKVDVQYNTFMDYYNYCLIPYSDRNNATGYNDGGELSADIKMKMYESLF